jgi:hypothetical protein
MTNHDFELAYLRSMQEWMHEEHNTRLIVMQRDLTAFPAQLEKEEAACRSIVRREKHLSRLDR